MRGIDIQEVTGDTKIAVSNVDHKLAEEEIAMVAKDEDESKTVDDETIIEPAEKISTTSKKEIPAIENISVVQEEPSTGRESIEKREDEPVEIEEYDDNQVKRNKGGGEERAMSWQRFAHAIEQKSVTNVDGSRHSTTMQA